MPSSVQQRDTERVREAADLASVVSQYVDLKPAGAGRLAGLCPFHGDKRTPSFTVSTVKNLWHCFGCGTGGDAFSFIQRIEGVPFLEARSVLADRFGVALEDHPMTRDERAAARRQRAYAEQLGQEAAWFWRWLTGRMESYAADLDALGRLTLEWLAERPPDHPDAHTARAWLFHCRRQGIRVSRALWRIQQAGPAALVAAYQRYRAAHPEIQREYREELTVNEAIERVFGGRRGGMTAYSSYPSEVRV